MRLVLSRRAEADLDEIAAYLHSRNPPAAQPVEDELQDVLRWLVRDPHDGRPIGRGLRLSVVPRLPCQIVYRVDEADDALFVVTIRHAVLRKTT